MTEFSAILPSLVDSTMLSCFRSCPTKFKWEFVYGLRPAAVSVDLHAGACFASALERFYIEFFIHEEPFERALAKTCAHFMIEWGDYQPNKETNKTKDRVWEAIESYLRAYPPATDHVQPYFLNGEKPTLEFTFAIPLDLPGFPLHPVTGDPFLYGGRFDLLGSYRGRPVVRDEKTTAYFRQNWADQWNLRAQFMGYVWAAQQSGIDLDTVCIRGIAILKTDIQHREAMKTFPSHIIDVWLEQTRRDINRLVKSWNEGYFDLNMGDHCTAYGLCPFMDLCQSPRPENWFSTYVVRRWNPTLKNPIAEAA